MTPSSTQQDVIQSLAIERQRAVLDAVGSRVGTSVVYLKAAWADPVLYGDHGRRAGVDIDVLVSPARFSAFASALGRLGFTRMQPATHPLSALLGKDWTFHPPPGFMVVDLHRALAVAPWFDLSGEEPLARARRYECPGGSILSLSPEDQIVFLAAHSSTHAFELDARHLEDTVRLCARFRIDWSVVGQRASAAHLGVALALVCRMLIERGIAVPESIASPSGAVGARVALLQQLLAPQPAEGRSGAAKALLVMPALSTRMSALPRFLASHAAARTADHLLRWFA